MFDFLVDSHCHLNMVKENTDLEIIFSESDKLGVKIFNNICTEISEFKDVLSIAENYNNVFCSVGIHPENVLKEETTVEELLKLSDNKKVIGIGEVGFEYHYEPIDKIKQKKNFEIHIEACRKTKLPLIIHSRDADEDMIDILNSEMKNGEFSFVLHCFSSGRELAYKALDLGGYISLSGIITFKKSNDLRDIVKDIPIDKIILETDAPFLAPEPKRGSSNMPGYVFYTAQYLVDFLKIPLYDIKNITTNNFLKLFNKVNLSEILL